MKRILIVLMILALASPAWARSLRVAVKRATGDVVNDIVITPSPRNADDIRTNAVAVAGGAPGDYDVVDVREQDIPTDLRKVKSWAFANGIVTPVYYSASEETANTKTERKRQIKLVELPTLKRELKSLRELETDEGLDYSAEKAQLQAKITTLKQELQAP